MMGYRTPNIDRIASEGGIFTDYYAQQSCTAGRAAFITDGMVEHDGQVGELLKKLDNLGIAENTIVVYTADNGAQSFSGPDGDTTPFRSEKNSVGKAAIGCRQWCAGPAPSNPGSLRPKTGCRL